MSIWKKLVVASVLAIALSPISAFAIPVYGTNIGLGDYSGSRSIAGGGLLKGGGSFTSAALTWSITNNSMGRCITPTPSTRTANRGCRISS
jgi:hypothetical protein